MKGLSVDQGLIRLTVAWNGERVIGARVASQRPQAAGLLAGRPVAEAVALAPRLFSLCGKAQGAAAQLAAAAATGAEMPVTPLLRGLVLEAIGEHLWRLLLDWPQIIGREPDKAQFILWRQRLLSARGGEDDQLLARDLSDWVATLAVCPEPGSQAARSPVLLPWLTAADCALQQIDAGFAAQPTFAGKPAETGPLARQFETPAVAALLAAGQTVAARLAARHADLDLLARALIDPALVCHWLGSVAIASDTGLARVETARGTLIHLMQVKDGRVGGYVIVAPTEWNFHPQGAFVREITGCPAATRDAAAFLARRLALALDPCVSHEVVIEEVNDA